MSDRFIAGIKKPFQKSCMVYRGTEEIAACRKLDSFGNSENAELIANALNAYFKPRAFTQEDVEKAASAVWNFCQEVDDADDIRLDPTIYDCFGIAKAALEAMGGKIA